MQELSRFSELTLIEAVNVFRALTQASFDKLMLRLSMDSEITPGYRIGNSVDSKANQLAKFAKENPAHQTPSGSNLMEEIVEQAARLAAPANDMAFLHALARDGFAITNEGVLRNTLPSEADLPQAESELASLLDEFNLTTVKGHLEQAISNHSQGNWAAANSQFRTFLEGLFDEIALRIEPTKAVNLPSGENRRQLLAASQPPFFVEQLGEWSQDGKNFVNGVFKRLHPAGPHPGLSDEEDCTFRFHMVLIVARYFLRRAKGFASAL